MTGYNAGFSPPRRQDGVSQPTKDVQLSLVRTSSSVHTGRGKKQVRPVLSPFRYQIDGFTSPIKSRSFPPTNPELVQYFPTCIQSLRAIPVEALHHQLSSLPDFGLLPADPSYNPVSTRKVSGG